MHGAGAKVHMCMPRPRQQATICGSARTHRLPIATAVLARTVQSRRAAGAVRYTTCHEQGMHKCKCFDVRSGGSQPP